MVCVYRCEQMKLSRPEVTGVPCKTFSVDQVGPFSWTCQTPLACVIPALAAEVFIDLLSVLLCSLLLTKSTMWPSLHMDMSLSMYSIWYISLPQYLHILRNYNY